MNEQLEAAIKAIPEKHQIVRNVCWNIADQNNLGELRTYTLGAFDMAHTLSCGDDLLDALTKVRKIVKELMDTTTDWY